MRGRTREASYEHSISDEILDKTNLGISGMNTLAIPMEAFREWKLNTTRKASSGTDNTSASDGVVTLNVPPLIRKDVPDPLNILPLTTRVPSSPGDSQIIRLTVPKPTMVAEPGDTGYAKTGDAGADKVTLTPHILVEKLLVSRLINVNVPTLLTNILSIGIDRMNEVMNEQLMVGSGAGNEIQGLYGAPGIGSSANLTALSGLTPAIVGASLDASFQFANSTKRIIVHPDAETSWKNTARPLAVARFYENGQIDGAPVIQTKYLSASDTKKVRGLVGPPADVYVKQWDDAVFVSQPVHRWQ